MRPQDIGAIRHSTYHLRLSLAFLLALRAIVESRARLANLIGSVSHPVSVTAWLRNFPSKFQKAYISNPADCHL